jgi:predicted nuclease of predicted toxin-antitoxin system
LAREGDRNILEYASAGDFVLVTTDRDFERLLVGVPGATVVILRACNYPTEVAAEVLRRNAVRIAAARGDSLIVLER